MMRTPHAFVALAVSLWCGIDVASAQSYRDVQVPPLPGFITADLTDLNGRLQGVGFSRLSTAGEGTQVVTWDLSGTRRLTAVSPINLGPLKINNAGIIVTTGNFRYVGGVSFRNDWLAIVNGVAYTLPSPDGESSATQLTDSNIVLMSLRLDGSFVFRDGVLRPFTATSITETGIGVATRYDVSVSPAIPHVVARFPDGGEFELWSGTSLGPVFVGPTGYVVQQTLSAAGDGFFVRAPDGRIAHAPVPARQSVAVTPPNSAGDIAGTMTDMLAITTKPFVYRNGELIDLNIASGLPSGSIRRVKKITDSGAILVSMEVPSPFSPGYALTDSVLIPARLDPPAAVQFAVSGGIVHLQWSASAGAADYVIEAGSAPGASDFFNGSVGPVTAISAFVPAGRYYVRIRARDGSGTSDPSAEVVIDVP